MSATPQFDFGMIGLGVMGSNLLLNMADKGFAAIGFDLKPERGAALEAAATPGTVVKGVNTLAELVVNLKTPRKIMMLVPAGKPVDDVIASLLPLLQSGDIVIDGGNSYFKDTLHRVAYLHDKGLHFFGMGVSGGEMGARTGPSLMPGGDSAAYEYLKPILESIAAKDEGGKACVAYMGNGAAGHYVKMVHNGIEYALMQLLAEVYDVLKRGARYNNAQLQTIFTQWNKGALQSFLMEVTADIFRTGDDATTDAADFLIDKILDKAGAKGTGKWTSQEAMDLPVPIPAIDAAVAMRTASVYKEERERINALYADASPLVIKDGNEFVALAEKALEAAFIICYIQGLNMLAKASAERSMNIPMPAVVQVWKAGCIIRSALLPLFEKAYGQNGALTNLLLDGGVAKRLEATIPALRQFTAATISASLPVACFSAALQYFDAMRTARLPTNLIQAQRDYFGAHTYQRTDKEGVFHTEWVQGSE